MENEEVSFARLKGGEGRPKTIPCQFDAQALSEILSFSGSLISYLEIMRINENISVIVSGAL